MTDYILEYSKQFFKNYKYEKKFLQLTLMEGHESRIYNPYF